MSGPTGSRQVGIGSIFFWDTTLDTDEYDFRVFDNPAEMHDCIKQKNLSNNRSRVVAGYCWKWPSKSDPQAWDIELEDFDYRRQWNLGQHGSLWIVKSVSVDQVGCIHTCQGLELDYVGVIVGPDLSFRNGKVVTDPSKRASSDQSVKGLKKLLLSNPQEAMARGDAIVKNTYRTLMTRGMKGCYVYCTDAALAAHLRSRLVDSATVAKVELPLQIRNDGETASNIVTLRRVSDLDRASGAPALPVVELRFAAGSFSEMQSLSDGAIYWVAPPDWIMPRPDLFVAQVIGESMNRKIPNGAWCLFRAKPGGTREGKIVVVQHRDIEDSDTGGRYTVKIYRSQKITTDDGSWRHTRVTLHPDSHDGNYLPIELELSEEQDNLSVVAEFLTIMPETTS